VQIEEKNKKILSFLGFSSDNIFLKQIGKQAN